MTTPPKTGIDREFAEHLLKTFDDPDSHGVHLLFNQWWRHAPEDVQEKYLADFRTHPEHEAFIEEGHFAEPIDLEAAGRLPPDTLGHEYHRFIVDNRLETKIALDYRAFHEALERSGALDGMPDEIRYAVLRGFQTHDIQHVLTGYDSSGAGEIALQAFCLAQLKFPYFAMWMSVVTTRMAFLDPDSIRPIMDAITDGWQFGRRTRSLQFAKWETMLEQPLAELRPHFGIDPTGRLPLAA